LKNQGFYQISYCQTYWLLSGYIDSVFRSNLHSAVPRKRWYYWLFWLFRVFIKQIRNVLVFSPDSSKKRFGEN